MTTTQTTIKTKANARAEAVESTVIISWENMAQEDIIAMAQQSLIIKLQGQWRNANAIPSGEVKVNATDFKVGVRAPKKTADITALAALVGKLSAEKRAELLAKLTA